MGQGLDIEVLGKKNMDYIIISFYFHFLSDIFGQLVGMFHHVETIPDFMFALLDSQECSSLLLSVQPPCSILILSCIILARKGGSIPLEEGLFVTPGIYLDFLLVLY